MAKVKKSSKDFDGQIPLDLNARHTPPLTATVMQFPRLKHEPVRDSGMADALKRVLAHAEQLGRKK